MLIAYIHVVKRYCFDKNHHHRSGIKTRKGAKYENQHKSVCAS